MHAHLKASQGASDVSLGYCPLDLFSGDRVRVTRALHTLWTIWLDTGAAVNNLRVFVGGRQLKPVAADAVRFRLRVLSVSPHSSVLVYSP